MGRSPHTGPHPSILSAVVALFWGLLLLDAPRSAKGQQEWGDVPVHRFAGWRVEPDYLVDFQFSLPGRFEPILNSCSVYGLVSTVQCSGRGKCTSWDFADPNSPTFCKCDRDWADPECRTKRKSQLIAFFYSLFFGYVGADRFYLGDYGMGSLKACSLGGFGVLYLYDLVNIGAGTPYASVPQHSNFYAEPHLTSYRLADDLPHWAFVTCVVVWFYSLGFTLAALSTLVFQRRKRREFLVLSTLRSNFPHLADRLLNPQWYVQGGQEGYGSVTSGRARRKTEDEDESEEEDEGKP